MRKLELAAKQEEEYLEKARLWQENWERQRRIQAEREIRQREEQKKFHELMIKAKRWKQAQLLREYLVAGSNPDGEWLSWANHKADWLDPITNAYDEWLTEKDLEAI